MDEDKDDPTEGDKNDTKRRPTVCAPHFAELKELAKKERRELESFTKGR